MRLESGTSLQHSVGWTRDLLRTVRYLANTEDDPFLVCCLSNVGEQLKLWNTTFPSIRPTHDVGVNSSAEVLEYLAHQKVKFNFRTKQELAELVKVDTTSHHQMVFRNSSKLGSHIKAAATAGVRDLQVDSLEELNKIKRFHGSARIHVELAASEAEKVTPGCLSGGSGAQLSQLALILSEASSLGMEVVGLSLNLRINDMEHEENLNKLKAAVHIAKKALAVARENDVEISTLHLGQICNNAVNLPRQYAAELENILRAEHFNNIKLTAEASKFLVASSTVLASRIIAARAKPESMEYYINESVFGIFSCQLTAGEEEEDQVPAPLPLGGSGNRKGLTGKLLESAIIGPTGDSLDQIIPLGDVVLPRMEDGDWLLFPNMGAMNMAEYVNSGRKIKGHNTMICLKQSSNPRARERNVPSIKQTVSCEKENVININLDLQNQNINFNLGSGLKGEIDLRKTFIFEN